MAPLQCSASYDTNIGQGHFAVFRNVATPEDCCNHCAAIDACIAWDYAPSNSPTFQRWCWLKDNAIGRVAQRHRIAGSKVQLAGRRIAAGQTETGQSIAALVIATPPRFARAAREALAGGLSPVERMPAYFSNVSRCVIPLGLRWEDAGSLRPTVGTQIMHRTLSRALATGKRSFSPEEFNRLKLRRLHATSFVWARNTFFRPAANLTAGEYGYAVAARAALQRVAASDRPAVLFEADCVLATSSEAAMAYVRTALLHKFDVVHLGNCGRFACTHAVLWTPRAARRFLRLRPTPCGDGQGPAYAFDKQLRLLCLQRSLVCKDDLELRLVVPMRLPREWTSYKLFATARGRALNSSVTVSNRSFLGYGHFVQDHSARTFTSRMVDEAAQAAYRHEQLNGGDDVEGWH